MLPQYNEIYKKKKIKWFRGHQLLDCITMIYEMNIIKN